MYQSFPLSGLFQGGSVTLQPGSRGLVQGSVVQGSDQDNNLIEQEKRDCLSIQVAENTRVTLQKRFSFRHSNVLFFM